MWVLTSPILRSWSRHQKGNYHVLHSQHIHTRCSRRKRWPAEPRCQSPALSLNNNLTNSDSLVEFFIHPCKFLKYSISFSFNKIIFLLSPKIHDNSLTITRDSPALEVHAKAAPRWLSLREVCRTVPGVRIY